MHQEGCQGGRPAGWEVGAVQVGLVAASVRNGTPTQIPTTRPRRAHMSTARAGVALPSRRTARTGSGRPRGSGIQQRAATAGVPPPPFAEPAQDSSWRPAAPDAGEPLEGSPPQSAPARQRQLPRTRSRGDGSATVVGGALPFAPPRRSSAAAARPILGAVHRRRLLERPVVGLGGAQRPGPGPCWRRRCRRRLRRRAGQSPARARCR